ncbi:SDR family NAD(P)-dependent oxidoreductase [Streptomyces sp. NPDC048484]|uniref:SDR family NAD(P)-dependent oxidoreductase n=1 Tax=Streptomyces sp. NPDC048484 TaxID=3155146 RepID=UPI003432ECC9
MNCSANILDSFRVDGARALVTGASRGIGQAVAVCLAQAGADVALSARSSSALEESVELVQGQGRVAAPVPADLATPGAAESVVDEAASALGGLDIVVHNAGILPCQPDGSPTMVPLQGSAQEDWDRVVSLNLNATAAVCRSAHRHLASSPRAGMVLMSSLAGVAGTPRMEAYAATKAAQISLVRSLGVGWASEGIRVNAVCPGWTRTDMTSFAYANQPLSDWLTAHVPMGRWAEPHEIASAVLFLVSSASSFLTGQALLIDGGASVPDGGLAGTPKPPSPFVDA